MQSRRRNPKRRPPRHCLSNPVRHPNRSQDHDRNPPALLFGKSLEPADRSPACGLGCRHHRLYLAAGYPELPGDCRRPEAGFERREHQAFLPGSKPSGRLACLAARRLAIPSSAATRFGGHAFEQPVEIGVVQMPQGASQVGGQGERYLLPRDAGPGYARPRACRTLPHLHRTGRIATRVSPSLPPAVNRHRRIHVPVLKRARRWPARPSRLFFARAFGTDPHRDHLRNGLPKGQGVALASTPTAGFRLQRRTHGLPDKRWVRAEARPMRRAFRPGRKPNQPAIGPTRKVGLPCTEPDLLLHLTACVLMRGGEGR